MEGIMTSLCFTIVVLCVCLAWQSTVIASERRKFKMSAFLAGIALAELRKRGVPASEIDSLKKSWEERCAKGDYQS